MATPKDAGRSKFHDQLWLPLGMVPDVQADSAAFKGGVLPARGEGEAVGVPRSPGPYTRPAARPAAGLGAGAREAGTAGALEPAVRPRATKSGTEKGAAQPPGGLSDCSAARSACRVAGGSTVGLPDTTPDLAPVGANVDAADVEDPPRNDSRPSARRGRSTMKPSPTDAPIRHLPAEPARVRPCHRSRRLRAGRQTGAHRRECWSRGRARHPRDATGINLAEDCLRRGVRPRVLRTGALTGLAVDLEAGLGEGEDPVLGDRVLQSRGGRRAVRPRKREAGPPSVAALSGPGYIRILWGVDSSLNDEHPLC